MKAIQKEGLNLRKKEKRINHFHQETAKKRNSPQRTRKYKELKIRDLRVIRGKNNW